MNPEGKLHDWTDLPEDEIPELQQIATGGQNPEIAHQMVENLQACKGRGKMTGNDNTVSKVKQLSKVQSISNISPNEGETKHCWGSFLGGSRKGVGGNKDKTSSRGNATFQSSYAEVFKNRRGMFEQKRDLLHDTTAVYHKNLDNLNLAISNQQIAAAKLAHGVPKPLLQSTKPMSKHKGNRV